MIEQYKQIPTLQDCEQLVKDYEWFSRSEQIIDGQSVVSFKYNLATEELYEAPFGLNMRGITFVDGELVALPFPKFYNVGEKDLDICKFDIETDLAHAYEKSDGSLICAFYLNGKLRVKSMKSVESDVAINAHSDIQSDEFWQVREFAEAFLDNHMTPMFEYVSPKHRIVLDYDRPDFIFLGARDMETGAITFPHEVKRPAGVTFAEHFSTKEQIHDHLDKSGVEGVVVTTKTGLMVKMKTAEYCGLHRVITNFSDKIVLESLYDKKSHQVDDRLDDMIGVMQQMNLDDLVQRANSIRSDYFYRIEAWTTMCKGILQKHEHMSRSELATMLFSSSDKTIGAACMAVMDNKPNAIAKIIFNQMLNEFKQG